MGGKPGLVGAAGSVGGGVAGTIGGCGSAGAGGGGTVPAVAGVVVGTISGCSAMELSAMLDNGACAAAISCFISSVTAIVLA